jgi:hypothetical protein
MKLIMQPYLTHRLEQVELHLHSPHFFMVSCSLNEGNKITLTTGSAVCLCCHKVPSACATDVHICLAGMLATIPEPPQQLCSIMQKRRFPILWTARTRLCGKHAVRGNTDGAHRRERSPHHLTQQKTCTHIKLHKKQTLQPLVCKRTIPTERPLLVDKI